MQMLTCLVSLASACLSAGDLEDAELALLCWLEVQDVVQPALEVSPVRDKLKVQAARLAKRATARRLLAHVYIESGHSEAAERVLRELLAEACTECAADGGAQTLALFVQTLVLQGKAEVCHL